MERRIDGGYAWVSVAASFTGHVIGFGIIYSFTVFFPSILQEFQRGRGSTAWIVSIAAALMLGAGGITGKLADRFGPARLLAAGAALIAAGLWLTSLATAIWQVYLSYGLLLGLGVSCTYVPSVATVSGWFERRRGLALGIAVAGSGVGSILLAPLSTRLIADHGWRGAMRILAVISLVAVLAAASVIRPRIAATGRPAGAVGIWGNRTFQTLFAASFIASYGYWVPFVHIVPFAEDRGLSHTSAAALVPLMGIANMSGRIIMGGLADRIGRHRMMKVSVLALALAMASWNFARSWAALAGFGVAYGLFAGAFIALLPALAGDYFGLERLAGITGALFSGAAVGTLLGSPVSGLLFDASGSYSLAIIFATASMAIGTAIMVTLPAPASIPAR